MAAGLVFGGRKTPMEFANFVLDCAAANEKGFRQPSEKYPALPTLAEQACIDAGISTREARPFGRRAKLKAKAAEQHVAAVLARQAKEGTENTRRRRARLARERAA